MKKLILIGLLTVFILNARIYAGNADLFNYNEAAIEAEFAQLNTLENYVSNYDVTLNELKANNSFILTELHLNNIEMQNPLDLMFGFEDIDWGSFAWGFCCWPIGIFTVLLKDEKGSDSKMSYFIGIGTGVVLGLISRIAL
ncbi:MAG: hypothetical protein GXO79_13010 [Chlorobi bacterium]|nr:hypothetical protein [Chlorobiota bacterium]